MKSPSTELKQQSTCPVDAANIATSSHRKPFEPAETVRSDDGSFLEQLESTSIHLIQRGVIRLLQMFPSAGIRQCDINEYNRQTRGEMEHIRDFIILHYHVTNRDDVEFWHHCRAMNVPDSLRHCIELFRETARVFGIDNELFAENSWTQVMLGQAIVPEQHHMVADLMGYPELSAFLEDIRNHAERTLRQLPTHQDYVQRYFSGRPGAAVRAGAA